MRWLCVVLLISSRCLADAAPSWALNPPKDTTSAKFYVGASSGAGSYAEAIELASKSALEQAIKQNFGVEAQVSNQSYETTTAASVTTSVSEVSRQVHIQGFETQDTVARHEKGGWSAWILFRYDRSQIEAEKRRLKSIAPSDALVRFNEISGRASVAGRLEVTTEPEGVRILVDGRETLYRTPVRLSGVLEQGQHVVQIDDPEFEPISREIIVQPGQTTTVSEVLIPATGSLSVSTIPSGAVVMVDGKMMGTAPLEDVKVPANKVIKLDFLDPNAERSSLETRVARDEHRDIVQRLPLKPAYIQIAATPAQAALEVDGRSVMAGWITIDPGSHHVLARADGYEDASSDIDLRGGERRTVSLKLVPVVEAKRRLETTPWIVGLGFSAIGASSNCVSDRGTGGVSLLFEKKITSWFGAQVTVSMFSDQASGSDSPSKQDMSGAQISAMLPIYLIREIYVGPEYVRISKRFTCSNSQSSASCSNSSALRLGGFGAAVGWQHFFVPSWGFQASVDAYQASSADGNRGKTAIDAGAFLLFRFP